MPSILALLLLVAHAHGITSGIALGPWKIDKSHLAYSYSTEGASHTNNQQYVPFPRIHTVRSPTPVTPLTYGFKPVIRQVPNVVLIQHKGLPYNSAAHTGDIYDTGKLSQSTYTDDKGPSYSFGPSSTFPTASPSYAPTPSPSLSYSSAGPSRAPNFSTLSPPKPYPSVTINPPNSHAGETYGSPKLHSAESYGPPKPRPSETYGPPKPNPSESYGPPKPRPSETYGPPKPKPSESYGPPNPHPSEVYGPPKPHSSETYGPPEGKPYDVAQIQYGPQHASYGPPTDHGPKPVKDEIKFIIYKPENEEVIKDTLLEHARGTGDNIKFVHGPNLEIKHDQKVYLPPPKKSIIYILLKEPEIHTKVQVLGGSEEGAKPEVFIIYETSDGVIRKHYDLTDEESRRVVSALGDKMRLTKRKSEEEASSKKGTSLVTTSTPLPSTVKN